MHGDPHLSPHDTDCPPDFLGSQHLGGPHPSANLIYPWITVPDARDTLCPRTCRIASDICKAGMCMDQPPAVMDDTSDKNKCRRERDDQCRD